MDQLQEEEGRLLGHNPLLDDEDVLSELFGARLGTRARRSDVTGEEDRARSKPTHYRIVSFSLYLEDIARLEDLVRRLKEKGYTKANKSQVIRYALATVDIEKMPTML